MESEASCPVKLGGTAEEFQPFGLNYTGIIGSGLPFRKKKASPRINIINLYKALENILPEHVNLEVRNGRLHFCLYRFHKWPEPRLFWIPLDFTEKLPGHRHPEV